MRKSNEQIEVFKLIKKTTRTPQKKGNPGRCNTENVSYDAEPYKRLQEEYWISEEIV